MTFAQSGWICVLAVMVVYIVRTVAAICWAYRDTWPNLLTSVLSWTMQIVVLLITALGAIAVVMLMIWL